MHLYVMAKGIKPHLETWQNELLAQKLPLYQNGEPLIQDGHKMFVQLAVRPVQLFEIGFPEECLNDVLAMVGTQDNYIEERYPILKYGVAGMRKTLGLKKVPKPTYINQLMQPNLMQKAVAVLPIGIKDDIKNKDGIEQL